MADVPAQDDAALTERVTSLERELSALRAEVAALRGRPAAPAQPAPTQDVEAVRTLLRRAPVRVEDPSSTEPVRKPMFQQAGSTESLESQLGAKVLSKVAIVLLLIGAAWFLKWAFDNRWIGPTGRIVAGLLAGVAINLWSERFRKQGYAAFSYALKAVGSGVLYLSLWASFQEYHLVPAGVAFAAMVCVTAWNGIMAWSQDAMVLAGYALLGAYLTPVLISTGGDHEVFLFSYLAVIAAAVVALISAKRWSLLLLAALPVTSIFFIAWFSQWFDATKGAKTASLALLLWAVFAVAALVAEDGGGVMSGAITPIGAALFGSLTIYSILADAGGADWYAWGAVGFGAVYIGLSKVRVERVLVGAVHLSLAIVFLTIAIPLKATGRGITIGWLVEALALLWVAGMETVEERARNVVRWLGWIALLLGVAGALVEPFALGEVRQAFLNREFATAIGAVLVLIASIWLAQRMPVKDEDERLGPRAIAACSLVLANAVMIAAMHHEIFRGMLAEQPTLSALEEARQSADFLFSGWMMVQGAAMMALGFWKRNTLARWIGLVVLGITVVKAFAYDMRTLGTGYRVVSYLGLGVVLMAVSFAYQKDWLGLRVDNHDEDPE